MRNLHPQPSYAPVPVAPTDSAVATATATPSAANQSTWIELSPTARLATSAASSTVTESADDPRTMMTRRHGTVPIQPSRRTAFHAASFAASRAAKAHSGSGWPWHCAIFLRADPAPKEPVARGVEQARHPGDGNDADSATDDVGPRP